MKLNFVAAAVLAAASTSSFAVGPGSIGELSTTPVEIANFVPKSGFLDTYIFSLAGPSTVFGSLTAANVSFYNIVGLAAAVQGSDFSTVGSDSSPGEFSFDLASGTYALQMFGAGTGTAGGYYSGLLFAQAVPEPETYALMLAGLGIVGFVAARRRSQG